jgi:hypothetical protein
LRATKRGSVSFQVPGHSSGLTDTLPKVFAFPSKPSVPVINFVDPDVVAAIQTIYDEIEEVFPSGCEQQRKPQNRSTPHCTKPSTNDCRISGITIGSLSRATAVVAAACLQIQ